MTSASRLAAAAAAIFTSLLLAAGAGARRPWSVRPVLTLRAHRLLAVRLGLLLLAAVLSSATVLALAASVDPSRAAAASRSTTGLSVPFLRLVSKPKVSRRKSSWARRAECAAAARTEKARKACVVARTKRTKPSASPKLAATAQPSVAPTSASTPEMADLPLVEALALPTPESTPPAGSLGGSGKLPVEPIPPVEESRSPVEKSKPPVEEPKPPVEAPLTEKASTATTLSSSLNPSTVGQAVTYTATVNAIAATGSITFKDAETVVAGCGDQTVSFGSATCTIVGDVASTNLVTATYNGDGDYVGSTSAPVNQVVGRGSTSTTLASSTNPSVAWQPVTYTAIVSPATATGTVLFEEAGNPIAGCTAQPLYSGAATCTHSGYTAAGTHSITATYSGDGNYLPSGYSSLTQVVDKMGTTQTTTVLSSSVDPSTVGQSVTYTATVSPAAATGTVAFDEAGTPIVGCAARPVGSGSATCTVAGLGVGGHWITAVYSGDGNYVASSSPGLTQTVNKKASRTMVASSLDPSTVGQSVTYTATVSPTGATGTVEFKQAGVTIAGCSARPVSSGTATCTVTSLGAGGHWITAVYSGDSNDAASSSPGLTQTVDKIATATTILSSLNPSTVSEAVTYTATLNTTAATGTVEFRQAGVTIAGCAAQPIGAGSAQCTVADLPSGWPSITAIYSGDSDYAASSSPGLTQTVDKKASTTTVVSSLDPSTVEEGVTYTATVGPTAATGTVTFDEAGTPIVGCVARPVGSGSATCTVAGLGVGGHWITAVYSGDGDYVASSSPGLTQTVTKKASTTAVASSLDPSTVGQSVTYTATVSPAAATGTVAFDDAGTPIAGCTAQTMSSGIATCTVAGYPRWSSHKTTAAYSGDSSYLASVSSVFTQTVEPPADAAAPFRFFSPSSFWNEPVPVNTPLDPSSAELVGALAAQMAEEEGAQSGPWINVGAYGVPIYTVPADQPTVLVTLTNALSVPALQSAWEAVPLPSDAVPSSGTDGELVVWQPSTDRLWEFWRLVHGSEGWSASWGGAIQNVSSNPGVYGSEAWPGARSDWGASASSLSIAGGLITLEDLERGQINHALAIAVPNVRGGVYASPAQRTDGTSTDPLSLPEGAHLRLDPELDLAALHLPRLALMIAEAAQRYGLYIRDGGAIGGFFGQSPAPAETNPYTGSDGYFEGQYPNQILAAFPWSHLQVLMMELHSTS
jgi:hypothetical protein